MEWLIWIGAALTMVGVLGLVWCIILAMKAKNSGLSDAEIKSRLQKVIALNLGALLISGLGLMSVVVGVILS